MLPTRHWPVFLCGLLWAAGAVLLVAALSFGGSAGYAQQSAQQSAQGSVQQPAPEHNVFNRNITKVALVVGAADYLDQTPLANPLNDARAVSAALSRLDFEVIDVFNPAVDDLKDAEDAFLDIAFDADIALFYFAGHSIQVNEINYLIPVDARLEDPRDLRRELIDVSRLVSRLDRLAKSKIVILDACRDNPFQVPSDDSSFATSSTAGENSATTTASRGLAPLSSFSETVELDRADEGEAYGTVIAYAAAAGRTATDGAGEHSPYTEALLKRLEEPGLEVGRMFRSIAGDVLKATNGVQRPEFLVRLTNEVYFRFPEPNQCDYLAAEPYNNLGIPGGEVDAIQAGTAIGACEAAVNSDPDNPRYLHNLARSLDAARRFEESIPYYRRAAERGFVFAQNNLGVMAINGQGLTQDFREGTEWLMKAAAQGYRQATVNLTAIDFLAIYEEPDFPPLAEVLEAAGYPVATPVTQESLRASLTGYQRANKLAVGGATLETLRKLGALDTIPAYAID